MSLPWIKRYGPEKLADIKGQDLAIEKLNDFVCNFKKHKKKAVIIYGPSGCGKTSSILALAKHHQKELIEVNASDFRNKDMIEEKIGNAIKQQSLLSKSKIILIDEINGLSGTKDRGGIPAIASLISISSFPVIMTADNPFDKKFSALRSKSMLVEFQPLNFDTVYSILSGMCRKEKIGCDDKALRTLARSAGGDLRAAINDLQAFSNNGCFTYSDLEFLPERNKAESMQNALIKIFRGSDLRLALGAFDNINEDIEKAILWIDENLPDAYPPEDLAKAYDALSRADVFLGRIPRQQHWRFLVYANALAAAGICAAKTSNRKICTYKQSLRILKLWRANIKYQKRKAIAEKIAAKTHSSLRRALQDSLPYIKLIFQNNKKEAGSLGEEFAFDEEEINWLLERPTSSAFGNSLYPRH